MTEKDLRELKRRFRPERSCVPKIVGCIINENREIAAKINQSIPLSGSFVSEKLLSVMKKALSGTLGTNLRGIEFSTEDVLRGDAHKLLMKLRESHLDDEEALSDFYDKVRGSLEIKGNYAILLANDVYDVPEYSKDGEESGSSSVFSYIVCAICPVKTLPESLSFKENEGIFRMFSASGVLGSPELGFTFPSFDDRAANIYSVLYYTRSVAENYQPFVEEVFRKSAPMAPKAEKQEFSRILEEELGEDCSLDLVRSVESELSEMVKIHKESKDPEPLTITKETVKAVLRSSGIEEDKVERVGEAFDEGFGAGAEISPKNLAALKRFEIKAPDITIKIDPEHRDLVSCEVRDNVKYVMIRVEGEVELNGVKINLDQ